MKKILLCLALVTAGISAQDYTCDGQDVADMAGSRVPPQCIQGKTCICTQYPPGLGDTIVYVLKKAKPGIIKVAHEIGRLLKRAKR